MSGAASECKRGGKCIQLTLTAHGALAFGRVLFYPLEDTVLFVMLVNERARGEKRWKRNNIPCGSCDRISQTLGTQRSAGYPIIEGLHWRLTQAALVARIFASRACAIKVDLADAADIVFREIPSPSRDGVPLFDLDLHFESLCLSLLVRCERETSVRDDIRSDVTVSTIDYVCR